jgi:integrase
MIKALKLTDATVRNLKAAPGQRDEYKDTNTIGLRLRVSGKTPRSAGKMTWNFLGRVNGKLLRDTLGEYPEMSLAAARARVNEIFDRGVDPREAKQQAKARDKAKAIEAENSFAKVAEEWIRKELIGNQRSKRYVRDTELALENHVYKRWADWHISKPTWQDCRDLLRDVKDNGTVVTDSSGKQRRLRGGRVAANHIHSTLKLVFRYAKYNSFRADNPMLEVERPGKTRRKDRYLDEAELRWLLLAADSMPYPHGPFVTTLLYTGSRRGEVLNMEWKHLDLDAEQPCWKQPSNKSDRQHIVALTPPVVALLKRLADQRINVRGPDGRMLASRFVFSGPDGRKPFYNMDGLKHMADRKIVGLRGDPFETPWTLHDLRRSFATHAIRLRVTETVVGRCLNHAPQGITNTVYNVFDYWPEKQAAWSTWSAYLESLITPPSDKVVRLRCSA